MSFQKPSLEEDCNYVKKCIESSNISLLNEFISTHDPSYFFSIKLEEKRFTIMHKIVLCDLTLMFYNALQRFIWQFKSHDAFLQALLSIQDDDGNTVLHYAAYRGNIQIISELIKLGLDYNNQNHSGLTVLHMAAQGDKPNVWIYFKEKYNMDITQTDNSGSTPLHWACYSASENSINYLLSWMTDISIKDSKGQTPWHMAIFSERCNIIKKLLNKGINSDIKDNEGWSVYDITKRDKKLEGVYRWLTDSKPVKTCLNSSAEKQNSFYHSMIFKLIFLMCESFSFFVLLPYINSYILSSILIVLCLSLLFSFIYICWSNPGILVTKYYKTWWEIVEDNIDVNELCPYCKVIKYENVKHCHMCGHCVENYDHHCFWINNCVGINNSKSFLLFLVVLLGNWVVNYVIGWLAYMVPTARVLGNSTSNFGVIQRPFMIFSLICIDSVKDVVSILLMTVCLFFIVPVCYIMYKQIKRGREMANKKMKTHLRED